MWPAEPAVIAMPMADASKRGELTGTCGCERDILTSPPQGFEAAEYRVNTYSYQLRNITIRTEFTFFTI
jgi:hypothetical protein